MQQDIDYVVHYGDCQHLFLVPQARSPEDALLYFFCIENYGQSRRFGEMDPDLALVVPLDEYLRDRDAFEQRVEAIRKRVERASAESLA